MRISKIVHYSLRLLIHLADNQPQAAPISASELAEQTGISVKFIEKIMRLLSKAKLVTSMRGIAGGHLLNVDPRDITLKDIIYAVEGGIFPPSLSPQEKGLPCKSSETWDLAVKSMEHTLDGYSLYTIMQSRDPALPHESADAQPTPKMGGTINAKARSLGRQRSRKQSAGN